MRSRKQRRRTCEGYRGDGPVRVGNAAVGQAQHDTYGSVILAAMPLFFDRRLPRPGDVGLFQLLETLGERAKRKALEPDAGIWEYRGRQRVHTHSAAMCWAGCQRLSAIAKRIGLDDRAKYWDAVAQPIHTALLDQAWNEKRGAFTAAFGSDDLDASVLLLPDLGVIEVDDPRFVSTVAAMERELVREKHVMRYANADDFGLPVTAFLICRFWLIDALWSLGQREAARDSVHRRAQSSQSIRASLRRRRSADRRALGQFPADLFDGGAHSLRHAAVAQLGRPLLARVTRPYHRLLSGAAIQPIAGKRYDACSMRGANNHGLYNRS